MRLSAICRRIIATDTGVLVLSAMALVALHTATNGQYAFHRDELATIDDARFLSWGYVVYPPITPFLARVSMTLFGASMIGLRLFAALAVGIAMVLTGLMARELGGSRPAQLVAAWAAAIAGPAVSFGYLFQYVSFDYLCWVLAASAPTQFHNAGFPQIHPCPRRPAWPRRRVPARAILGGDESGNGANMDRWAVFSLLQTRGKALPYARLDVFDPAANPALCARQTLLSRPGLPHAACRRRCLGRAMVGRFVPSDCCHHSQGGSEKHGGQRSCDSRPGSAAGTARFTLVENR
jgi:Dolichyl-phosphate-mannose-protein mannosyltransferase